MSEYNIMDKSLSGANVINLFSPCLTIGPNMLKVFVYGKPLQPTLMFASWASG